MYESIKIARIIWLYKKGSNFFLYQQKSLLFLVSWLNIEAYFSNNELYIVLIVYLNQLCYYSRETDLCLM